MLKGDTVLFGVSVSCDSERREVYCRTRNSNGSARRRILNTIVIAMSLLSFLHVVRASNVCSAAVSTAIRRSGNRVAGSVGFISSISSSQDVCNRIIHESSTVATELNMKQGKARFSSYSSGPTTYGDDSDNENSFASYRSPSSDRFGSSSFDNSRRPQNGNTNKMTTQESRVVSDILKLDYQSKDVLITSNPIWNKLGLKQEVIDVLSNMGITHLTPVQAEAFQPIMNGQDVLGRSRTGTGKTLAFGMPSLLRLPQFMLDSGKRDAVTKRNVRGRSTSMLVLCPTRELARQVHDELKLVADVIGLSVDCFHGGVSYGPQERALSNGIDCLVGTPGRLIDHLNRGNLNLNMCDLVVLDEADEMLNMGFADDVEEILKNVGTANQTKTQVLLFSATTPSWVSNIGRKYQSRDVYSIDSTTAEGGGSRVATTVRHVAIQVPPGEDSKKAILEDIIAVEISRDDIANTNHNAGGGESDNVIAAAAMSKKRNSTGAMNQKIFGKTIVFTETKRFADELVSGGVFKSITAQALHGDVGQKQRDAILNAFRAGAFNVLVATDVAARGIDIRDVDLVIQMDPPRDTDTYVHRSGRTGRAGRKGVSVLLFSSNQAPNIVRIERDLGHDFQFQLSGVPSVETTLKAVAKTTALATTAIPDSAASYFLEAAESLLASNNNEDIEDGSEDDEKVDPVLVVAKCLAAIARRSTQQRVSRSILTGKSGITTIKMTNPVRPETLSYSDVMFTIGKLSRMSQETSNENYMFDKDVDKIDDTHDRTRMSILFDMDQDEAAKMIAFASTVETGGLKFEVVNELEIDRSSFFGRPSYGSNGPQRGGRSNYGGGRGGGRDSGYGGSGYAGRSSNGGGGGYSTNRRSYTTASPRGTGAPPKSGAGWTAADSTRKNLDIRRPQIKVRKFAEPGKRMDSSNDGW